MSAVLLTRPKEQCDALATLLARRGFKTIVAPMLDIDVSMPKLPAMETIQSVLFTSRQAPAPFAKACVDKKYDPAEIKVLAVGAATADAARLAGFGNITMAAGNAEALIKQAKVLFDKKKGPLLYVRGNEISADIAQVLAKDGLVVENFILYHAQAAASLPKDIIDAMFVGEIGYVLLYSVRTAETLVSLIKENRLSSACPQIIAICMSDTIADAARGVQWKSVRVASEATEEAMIADLEAARK